MKKNKLRNGVIASFIILGVLILAAFTYKKSISNVVNLSEDYIHYNDVHSLTSASDYVVSAVVEEIDYKTGSKNVEKLKDIFTTCSIKVDEIYKGKLKTKKFRD